MENNFDHARAFAHEYLQKIGQGLDQSSMVRLMTEWAATLSAEAVKETISEAGSALEAELRAKITQLEAMLAKKPEPAKEPVMTPQEPTVEPKTPKAKKSE